MMNILQDDMNREQFAEIKGFLCGFICTGNQSEGKPWLDTLIATLHIFDSNIPLQRELFIELYKQVADDVHRENLGLQDTLFEREQPLIKRAYALKKWCMGFLGGLEQAGFLFKNTELEHTFHDRMTQFDGLSKLDLDEIDVTDADEAMFDEMTHHIEKGVLAIYHALHQGTSRH